MSENTKIEWTDHTWSPWYGCTKVSPGCANCYAETLNKRFAKGANWGKGKPRRKKVNWREPVRWNRSASEPVAVNYSVRDDLGEPARAWYYPKVFPSQCDWLDPEVPIEWLAEFLKLIHDTPYLTWLLLTKRPELWQYRLALVWQFFRDVHDFDDAACARWVNAWCAGTPPRNVWVGTSVEDQPRADERIPPLLKIPAVLRFLSVEPLLGAVDLLTPTFNGADSFGGMVGIDWVIIGGESGSGARPCNIEWIRSIRDQCHGAGVPVFVKQIGADAFSGHAPHRTFYCTAHPKGGDPSEWPEDLRVRQMPNEVAA